MYFERWGKVWVRKKIQPFLPFLNAEDRILDIGSGNGLVAHSLREAGYEVTPLDVADLSYDASVRPIVYDGRKMPFKNGEFDVALLLTVLHHTNEPNAILAEACRVAPRVIIIEDIYENNLQKKLTFAIDSFVNWGYAPCPHTNQDDAGWQKTFRKMKMNVPAVVYRRVLFLFKQGIYHIVKA